MQIRSGDSIQYKHLNMHKAEMKSIECNNATNVSEHFHAWYQLRISFEDLKGVLVISPDMLVMSITG